MNIDIYIIFGYLILLLIIGILSSRKLKSIDDFAVSNVKYGKTVIFITMCCSFLGGGFSFGNATEVYKNGIGNILILCGFSVGQMLIGKYIVPKIDTFKDCISTGNIIGKVYGRGMQIITGILSTMICAGILGAQVSVLGNIFQTFIGIPSYIGVIIGFGIVLVYSTIGGIKADIITDIIQFFILIIGLPILIFYGINEVGGIDNIIQSVPNEYWNVLNNTNLVAFISAFFTLMMGEMLIPPYVQRLLIGKNTEDTAKSTILSGYTSVIFFIITGSVGLIAFSLDKNMNPDLAMIGIIQKVLPIGLSGIIVSAMMAIVLSTADSFLNSAAVGIIDDVYIPLKEKYVSQKDKLKMARIANVLIGIIAILVAMFIPNLLDILTFSYSFWAPTILPVLLFTILGIKIKKHIALFGVIIGFFTTFIWDIVLLSPYGINGLIVGFILNVVTTIILHLIFNMIYIPFRICNKNIVKIKNM